MSLPLSGPRRLRPLVRTFHPARGAAAALAQVYELLLPGGRRPLPLPPPRAAPRPAPRRTAAI